MSIEARALRLLSHGIRDRLGAIILEPGGECLRPPQISREMPENRSRETHLANFLQRIVGLIEQLTDEVELPPGLEADLRAWLGEVHENQKEDG